MQPPSSDAGGARTMIK